MYHRRWYKDVWLIYFPFECFSFYSCTALKQQGIFFFFVDGCRVHATLRNGARWWVVNLTFINTGWLKSLNDVGARRVAMMVIPAADTTKIWSLMTWVHTSASNVYHRYDTQLAEVSIIIPHLERASGFMAWLKWTTCICVSQNFEMRRNGAVLQNWHASWKTMPTKRVFLLRKRVVSSQQSKGGCSYCAYAKALWLCGTLVDALIVCKESKWVPCTGQ